MKKQITGKLHLNKETLRNLSDRDLKSAIGGATFHCVETGQSYCVQCVSEGSCISYGSSCLTGNARCCC
jgi:hypothetical protein